jgi:hypothetical protein
MYYLATPYSDPDPAVKQHRYEQAMEIQHYLLQRGYYIYSPIVALHPLALTYSLPGDAAHWFNFNTDMICCSIGIILALIPGYEQSKGMLQEFAIAKTYLRPRFIIYKEKNLFRFIGPTYYDPWTEPELIYSQSTQPLEKVSNA